MMVSSKLVALYKLMLETGASEETARVVAMALYKELKPNDSECAAREAVSHAVATVKIKLQTRNDVGSVSKPAKSFRSR
jgi:hypothetical protein